MRTLLLPALLLLLAACATGGNEPVAAPSSPATPDDAARATALVRALAAGDWVAAAAGFSAEMREGMPPEGLAAPWAQITAQAGPFREIRGVSVDTIPQGRIAVVETAFERAVLDVRVSVLPSGEFGGLFFAPHAPSTASAPPDYGAPADAPYTAEEVRIPVAAGWELAGTLTLPRDAAGPVPAVVLVSGSGPQNRDGAMPPIPGYRPFRQIAEALAERGIATLRVDDRGVGASGGDPSRAATEDLAVDIRSEVGWLRARREIDAGRVALVGHSEGGLIASIVAANDSEIRAVALLAAPARTGREISDYQIRETLGAQGKTAAQIDSLVAANEVERAAAAAVNPWLRFWLDYDPLPAARRVRTPVLVLQGATDRQVTAEQAEELAAAIRQGGNTDVTVQVFPAVNHLFVPDPDGTADVLRYAGLPDKQVTPEVIRTLTDWLEARLR